MTIPQVGVTGVIQDQGFGGTVGAGAGGLAQFLMGLEKIRADDANDKARIAMEKQKQDFAQQQAAAALAEQQRQDTALGKAFGVIARPDRAPVDVNLPSLGGLLGGQVNVPGFERVEAAFATLEDRDRPAFAAAAKDILSQIAKEREGYTLGEGDERIDPRTQKVVAKNVKAPNLGTDFEASKQTVGLGAWKNADLSPTQNAAIRREMLRQANAGASRTNVWGSDGVGAAMMKGAIDNLGAEAPAMREAAGTLPGLYRAQALLNSGKVNAGTLAGVRQLWSKAINSTDAAATDLYVAEMVTTIFPQLKGELGGNMATKEVLIKMRAAGADPALQLSALKDIVGNTIDKAITKGTDYNERVMSVIGDRPGIARSYIVNLPPPPASNDQGQDYGEVVSVGRGFVTWTGDNKQYAVKTKTDGQRYIRVYANGKWVELGAP